MDQVFIAEVPELAGCIAHGDTQEAALANANQAIALWIATAQEFGDPIPVFSPEGGSAGGAGISPAVQRRVNTRHDTY